MIKQWTSVDGTSQQEAPHGRSRKVGLSSRGSLLVFRHHHRWVFASSTVGSQLAALSHTDGSQTMRFGFIIYQWSGAAEQLLLVENFSSVY